ncbi:MAG: hypothetical protein AAF846_23170, partial [Chloroflexota bacterium]
MRLRLLFFFIIGSLFIIWFVNIDAPQAQDNIEHRSFYMGMSPFPYDLTQSAQNYTYRQIDQHGDMVLHHMDTGIPWQEALDGSLYHAEVLQNIQQRIENRRPDQQVYLSITPNSSERNQLAGYWAENENMPLPSPWQGRTFDHPDVIQAFLNHARYMIDAFNPDYFAYAIEVTCGYQGNNDNSFQSFRIFCFESCINLFSKYQET